MAEPSRKPSSRPERWFLGLIVAAMVLMLLVQARFFLIPLAIAILLFSLTTATIDFIARLRIGPFRLPNWLASIAAVILIATILLVLFGFVSSQIDGVLTTAPAYAERIQEAIAGLFALLGDDVSQGMLAAFQDIDFGTYIRSAAGSAGNLLTATVLVILYVGFLFAERPWFDDKLALLFPDPKKARHVSRIFSSISSSVHHYMLVKTAVSALTGITVYVILLMFGLDFAEALGILTFVLNFIPNLGSIVATALPALVALVQFDGWPPVIAVLAVVGVAQFSLGNILDPMMMGRALQMSSFAIVISLTLWGAIWGVAGMFLAVPIMVMVMIVCSHIPRLRPFAILLSRDGAVDAARREKSTG